MAVSLAKPRPISGLLGLWNTTIGKKVVMAITGFIGYGYVILHLWGNLKVYAGRDYINEYGVGLRNVGAPIFGHEQLLWIARVVLVVAVVLHVLAAYQLTRLDWASRPVAYAQRRTQQASFASRTMRWGGVIIALFIVYHILHFTTGSVHGSFREGDIYHNLISGFQVWYVSLFYILAMLALGLHLYHGIWSMFQTLGLNNTRNRRIWQNLAVGSAVVLAGGNITIPLAVLAGVLK